MKKGLYKLVYKPSVPPRGFEWFDANRYDINYLRQIENDGGAQSGARPAISDAATLSITLQDLGQHTAYLAF